MGVKGGRSLTLESSLKIPSDVNSSNSRICSNLQINYELYVTAFASGFHKNISVSVPITIISKSSHDSPESYDSLLNSNDDGEFSSECMIYWN